MEVFALRIEYHPIAATLCVVLFLLVGCATEQSKPALLAKIAVEDEAWTARLAAVERLTDQALLAKIAVEDEAWTVRLAAVERLTDQALLAKIAVEDKAWTVRRAAVERLTDQALLAKIAEEDKAWTVRRAAMVKLAYQAVKPIGQEAAAPVSEEGPPKREVPELSPWNWRNWPK
jgi:outer membrane biogenesis lipoprotein LolB